MQDFELIRHPDTGKPWWAPGPLAFEHVLPTKRPNEPQSDSNNEHDSEQAHVPESAVKASADITTDPGKDTPRLLRRSPVTCYTLNRKSLVDMVGGRNKKYVSLLLAIRTGMAVPPDSKQAVWREDMGDMLLHMMRKQATDALVARGSRLHGPKHKFVEPCASWEDVKAVRQRGCVLWLPGTKDAAGQYATLDIEEAQYGRKMAVHNLRWLLGEEEVQRLRASAEVFQDGEIFVLKQWPSTSMMRLHLLLWRLQGYLAEPDTVRT